MLLDLSVCYHFFLNMNSDFNYKLFSFNLNRHLKKRSVMTCEIFSQLENPENNVVF